ncbi:MAG: HNH endonuclease [Deltaproteobacteria bacterium]|nr:HNH endonuclease [Deltaproteobacteria bacterium]
MTRKSIPGNTRRQVLHEAGYKCGNPVCRTILTLDFHHLIPVSREGSNRLENLLPLCPNCHALHHKGEIPIESIRSWKMLLLALNEAFDRRSIDLLLAIESIGQCRAIGQNERSEA